MIKHILLATALSTSSLLSTCQFSTHAPDVPVAEASSAAAPSAAIGSPAPAFTLRDQNGAEVKLADMLGKVVVLEWVNPDCPFVKRHGDANTMKTLAERYASKDVVWLGINTTKYMGAEDNKKWIAAHGLPYRILDDHDGTVGRMYGAKTTPHMYIVDAKGMLVYAGAIDDDNQGGGANPVNYVDRALGELTSGKPVSTPQTKPYGCSVKYAN